MRRRIALREANEPNPDLDAGYMAKQSDFRHGGQGAGMSVTGAERGGSLREMGGVGFLLRNAEEFNLTESQQESLSKMRTPFELEKIDKLAALQKEKSTFRALVRDHHAAEQDVLYAIETIAAREADLRKMRYYHLKAARAQLDADQLDRLMKKALRAR